jgi:hypothetical protein
VAERLCRGLQILVRRFDSGLGLQSGSQLSCSPVAQLVERVAVNHFVAGSSPARGATLSNIIFIIKSSFLAFDFFWSNYEKFD